MMQGVELFLVGIRQRPGGFIGRARGGYLALLLVLVALVFGCEVAAGERSSRPSYGEVVEMPTGDRPPAPDGEQLRGGSSGGGQAEAEQALVLRFLDVGQGDAVLIQSPTGQNVLYDGGDRTADLVPRLRRLGVTELTLVIASHNHADHIGGLPEVIRAFRPRFVMENGLPHTTRAYERFLLAIEAAGSQLLEPERRAITLGEAELLIVPPPGRASWGQNDNSVGMIVRFGEFRASLLGDAEPRQMGWWLATHRDLLQPVHVHKASHHGSRRGDTRGLLEALQPKSVVIGLAADNRYGHPHREALDLYRQIGARVCRTDLHGTVTIEGVQSGEYRVHTEVDSVAAGTDAAC
ncbi:ComEC/Rec2 family competence protein [soil metagenome]